MAKNQKSGKLTVKARALLERAAALPAGVVDAALAADAAVVVVEAPAAPAKKLTKRNATLTSAVLVATDKTPKNRAGHIVDAWATVVAMLPATAAACIAEIDKLGQNPNGTNASYLSYWMQRGFLAVKATD